MSRRVLTEEEKALLAAVMQDVRPLVKTSRASVVIKKPTKTRFTIHDPLASILDLHGLTLVCAHAQLLAFIEAHAAAGSRELLVITGKSGQLARDVPRWLTLSDMKMHVSMVSKASPRQGGEGALCIRLKRKQK